MSNAMVNLTKTHERAAAAHEIGTSQKLTVREWLQLALWTGTSISIGLAGLVAALIERA